MKKNIIIVLFPLFIIAQGNYEKGMSKGFQLWQEGKNQEAINQFSRIAKVEKENWIPSYYAGLVSVTSSFQAKENETEVRKKFLSQAEAFLAELSIFDTNSEILVLEAQYNTALVSMDPMNLGAKLSPKINKLYLRALELDASNPRAIYGLTEYKYFTAKFFNEDLSKYCMAFQKALVKFEEEEEGDNEKFMPNWGKDRAEKMANNCSN